MTLKLQFSLRTLLLWTALSAVLLGIGVWLYRNLIAEQYHVATLHCGGQRRIVITADASWEMSQTVYYSVRSTGRTPVPMYAFTDMAPNEEVHFSLVTSEDGELAVTVASSAGRNAGRAAYTAGVL